MVTRPTLEAIVANNHQEENVKKANFNVMVMLNFRYNTTVRLTASITAFVPTRLRGNHLSVIIRNLGFSLTYVCPVPFKMRK